MSERTWHNWKLEELDGRRRTWRFWEPVDGVDMPDDRGGPVLGPSTSVAVIEKVYEPDDAALRKLLRLLKGERP